MVKGKKCSETNNSVKAIKQNGKILKILRKSRKLTLKEMSKLSGVQTSTISRLENSKRIGSLNNYSGIAKAFGLRLSELFATMERV